MKLQFNRILSGQTSASSNINEGIKNIDAASFAASITIFDDTAHGWETIIIIDDF